MLSIQDSLVLNNSFRVCIGPLSLSFSKVRNISSVLETEPVLEGGFNSHVQSIVKQHSTPETLVLERGILMNPLGLAEVGLTTGVPVYAVIIMVMRNRKIVKTYTFEKGIITRWELGELNANDQSVLYKTIEITHSGLHEIPVPPI